MQYFSVSRYFSEEAMNVLTYLCIWSETKHSLRVRSDFFFYCWAFVFDSLEKSKITNFYLFIYFFPQKRIDSFPVNFGIVNDYIGIFWNILSQ